ncbi:MaoC family dehydratase [Ottowia sp.]|uniref:MaoC family dehydratase n=1 Tax=Ottowia sp. TaxID=1898956 RepID=UPI001D9A6578|nr:MaoC family dehydratase [Ottowia sp.]MCP5257110.1 MaoC family dehydratase [Burkholderiaceae bacterium]MCB2034532.1 MaoC family dehydratase [Ottowia sp.]HPK33631.1 MaoC family dehydratase [Ottowia sp.]HPR45666.1 MaoC family dehydratase [Ottowia sp.]HRW71519.1 MaoC family dehydratase [Ottowia sp.]
MRTFDTLADLAACAGQEITLTDWHTVTQDAIDKFADATGDHQWIHVDPERAKAGPFGTTIAHGYLTLSLLAGFFDRSIKVRDVRMGINYGSNKVRFMSPVPVNSRLRVRIELLGTTPIDGGLQLAWRSTIEREGSDKPACVAESLARYYL